MSKKKKSAVARWNAAVLEAYAGAEAVPADDEGKKFLEEALAISDADVDKELEASGVDLRAFDAESEAQLAAFKARLAPPESAPDVAGDAGAWVATVDDKSNVRPIRSGRRSAATYAAAAAAAAAAVGVSTYLATRPPPDKPDVKTGDAGEVPSPSASAAPVAPPPAPTPDKPAPAPRDDKAPRRR
jgi:hypothetical protein